MKGRVVVMWAVAVAMVVGAAVWTMAADSTPGFVRLEGEALAAARAAKAAHKTSREAGKIVTFDTPITVEASVPRAAGTIQYDNGSYVALGANSWRSFGNRFNSALNTAGTAVSPVQISGSVTKATFGALSVAGATTWGPFWITLYDQLNTGAGTAQVVGSAGFSVPGGPHTSPFLVAASVGPWSYSGSSFLLGILDYNTNATTPNGVAPLLCNFNLSAQGYHAYSMAWSTTTGTDYQTIPSLNVIIRATGNVIVPVELMGFTVE